MLICILAWGICIFAIDVLIETLERSGVFICNEAGCCRLGGRWGFALKRRGERGADGEFGDP